MRLPEGWTLEPLGGVSGIRAGVGFPERLQGRREGPIPVFKVGDISKAWLSGNRFLDAAQHYLTDQDVATLRAATFAGGSTVFAKIGAALHLNRRAVLANPSLVDNNVFAVTPGEAVDDLFLYYFMCTQRLGELSRGGVVPSLRQSDVAGVHLPLAPLPEQRRVVAKIEELFSHLDAGVAALERAEAKLKRYRASVLKSAVEGKLTDEWRDSFQESNWRSVGEAIISIEQGWSPRCESDPAPDHSTWGVIKTTAVQHLSFEERENKTLPVSLRPRPELELKVGDILVTRAGPRSRVGVACLVRHTRPRLILCDKVYRLRVRPETILPEFLEIVLNAPPVLEAVERLKSGISDSGVNLTQQRFCEVRLPIPHTDAQRSVVSSVGSLLVAAGRSTSDVCLSRDRAAALRRSILKRAFEGRLVPQDPTDEPASVLLERIHAARATKTPKNARARRNPTQPALDLR